MCLGDGEVMPHRDPETARKYRKEKYRLLKERDPEYGKRMYRKHREKRLAESKAKREADPEKARAYSEPCMPSIAKNSLKERAGIVGKTVKCRCSCYGKILPRTATQSMSVGAKG
jgi:hypothetical protein